MKNKGLCLMSMISPIYKYTWHIENAEGNEIMQAIWGKHCPLTSCSELRTFVESHFMGKVLT